MKDVSLVHKSGESSHNHNQILVFNFEDALLRSTSLFPYMMLVAFEAGGILRSLILFLFYPLIWLVGNELGLRVMVFLSFFGIKKEKFRMGSSVLPKSFLEDVGWEGFEAVVSCGRKVAVSNMPRIMIEGFLKDYIGVEAVVAKEMKSLSGYFLGLYEEKKADEISLDELHKGKAGSSVIGKGSKYVDQGLFSNCTDFYLVSEAEKRKWSILPREKYPKPLIFHDGRLAFRPTPTASLSMFMWLPLGLFLSVTRLILGILLPFNVSTPILAFTGTRTTVSMSQKSLTQNEENQKGMLYVSNHRTLLDPVYVAIALGKPLCAVTYSLSRFSELVAPIKTVRLTRDTEKDRKTMEKQLSSGNLVVCPEGTTCREPYLLRFSPLFAELTDKIVPVALDVKTSMFYGTTASGKKCLDSFIHFLNPNPSYFVKILETIPKSEACKAGGKSRIEAANFVQNEIATALGFACTRLTRKNKYMILAGNEGVE